MTADELRKFIRWLKLKPSSQVFEVGSGSGGPALFVAQSVGCHINGFGVKIALALALARRRKLDELTHFEVADATRWLRFVENTFDAVLFNDAMCHVQRRSDVLRDWFRVLKPGGQRLFTDAMVMTGALSNDEIALRSSIGTYCFLPPGENERMIRMSGFRVVRTDDATANVARIAKCWLDARAQR